MKMRKTAIIPSIASICLLVGCAESEIKTYKVAKEERPAVPNPAAAGGGQAHGGGGGLPHVHGNTPPGWSELPPERMRVASFQIRGDGGRLAQMALIPLPGTTGIQLQSINLWREELGLKELTSEEYKNQAQRISVGGLPADFFHLNSDISRPGEDFKRATLGAIFERDGVLWFAKMTGEASLVNEHKENFQKYLASLEFHDGSHDEPRTAATPVERTGTSERPVSANTGTLPADSKLPRLSPPANWQEKAPGPMVDIAYAVVADGGQADVTISKLAGDGGGVAGNVNRWRGQLGLQPVSASEIDRSVAMIEVNGRKDAYVIDIKGTNARTGKAARMIAAGVPSGGETWFYKIMGDDVVIEKEKAAFVKFIQDAH